MSITLRKRFSLWKREPLWLNFLNMILLIVETDEIGKGAMFGRYFFSSSYCFPRSLRGNGNDNL